ncbi:hypothetical protein [Tateyamaria omphalii]|uniref:hypothetical protein n=1 Tax=Tateyamaria omphalii TaxID=299262 RepID=UPI0012FC0179|nr:hypothetical protein [Tateyamaria omphalii]
MLVLNLYLKRFLANAPFGIFLGASIASTVAILLDAEIAEEWKRWGTYGATALVSLISATLAVAGVLFTVDHQTQIKRSEREGKVESARAFLPNALSQICEVARKGFHQTYTYSSTGVIRAAVTPTSISSLGIPDEAVRVLRDLLENIQAGPVRDRIAGILREHQILVARTNGVAHRIGNSVSPEDYRHAVHWAYLYALVGSLFDYARNETNTITSRVTANDVENALSHFQVFLTPNTITHYRPHTELYERHFDRRFP